MVKIFDFSVGEGFYDTFSGFGPTPLAMSDIKRSCYREIDFICQPCLEVKCQMTFWGQPLPTGSVCKFVMTITKKSSFLLLLDNTIESDNRVERTHKDIVKWTRNQLNKHRFSTAIVSRMASQWANKKPNNASNGQWLGRRVCRLVALILAHIRQPLRTRTLFFNTESVIM